MTMTSWTWKLFLDDEREPADIWGKVVSGHDFKSFILCTNTGEAMELVKELGVPSFMSLDHDLGGNDTGMRFVRKLSDYMMDNGLSGIPEFYVHSANPVGKANITEFMASWHRACE